MNKGKFTISATESICVNSYGHVKIHGKDLSDIIKEHFGFDSLAESDYQEEAFVGKIYLHIANIQEPLTVENTMELEGAE